MFSSSYNIVFNLFICVISVQCAFDRIEGEPCQTEQGRGTCVHIFKCLSSLLDLKKKDYPQVCSFQGNEPVICCNDCQLVNDTRNAIADREGGIYFRTGQKARDECIKHLTRLPYSCQTKGLEREWNQKDQCYRFTTFYHSVVAGGDDAERSQYPHMALLGYGSDEKSAQWLCGGSLISDRFVLTAAHCISPPVLGTVKFVGLGILKRSDPEQLWQVHTVRQAFPHPEYRPPSKYHDIALLMTDRPVKYSKDTFPACLDFDGQINWSAFATGWGKLGNNRPLADTLQVVSIGMFSDEECQKTFPPHRLLKEGYKPEMQMCYGDAQHPKDTCEGDSGGPLLVTSLVSRCLHTIIGVTSFGRACGFAGDAGMYSRVYHYVPWIESIVWPGN